MVGGNLLPTLRWGGDVDYSPASLRKRVYFEAGRGQAPRVAGIETT